MRRVLAAAVLLALSGPQAAHAADRWIVTGRTTLPPQYWQGVAFDPAGDAWFSGPLIGLYRTDARLRELGRTDDALVPDEPFNHIGDLEWDPREGGRLLLPLECYAPTMTPSNFCGIGAVGVADPVTFARRYTVVLAGVPKAMWLALGPDGLLWTQGGSDLLAFDADALAPGAGPLPPVRSFPGVLPFEPTGAAVLGGRLYVAGQPSPSLLRLWSIDLADGSRRLEARRHVTAESEGLASFPGLGGRLHWLIAPGLNPHASHPHNSVLLHLNPRGRAVPGRRQRLSPIRLTVLPPHVRAGQQVTLLLRARARVVGQPVPADGAVVTAGGRRVTLDASGAGQLTVRAPRHGTLVVRASRPAMRPAVVRLPVRR